MTTKLPERETPFQISLLAGGLAGTSVDVMLFPMDTIKTRLQSAKGFWGSGGFRGIYSGLGAVAIGSAPGAALFFSVYEHLKVRINTPQNANPIVGHICAASVAESFACMIRVPTEVIKLNMQVKTSSSTSLTKTIQQIIAQKDSNAFMASSFGGLYRGYSITLMREIPFAMIQFPLYENMKKQLGNGKDINAIQAAICGSISGAIAAACTTPHDVIKTRLMIGKDKEGILYKNGIDVFSRILKDEGWKTLFSGLQPRVLWISIGGFIFFGAYEEFRMLSLTTFRYH